MLSKTESSSTVQKNETPIHEGRKVSQSERKPSNRHQENDLVTFENNMISSQKKQSL